MYEQKLNIIANRCNENYAYSVFTVAAAAAKKGQKVVVFCHYEGVHLLALDVVKSIKIPFFKLNVVESFSVLLKRLFRVFLEKSRKEVNSRPVHKTLPSIGGLRTICVEYGVRFIACEMSVQTHNYAASSLMRGVQIAGISSFFEENRENQQILYL